VTDFAVHSEHETISAISDGDEQAFLLLFKQYSPLIRPFVRRLTYSEVDADEIIQETFIRIWLYRDKLPGVKNLRGWIFTVASNESMRYMRSKLTYEKNVNHSQKSNDQQSETTPEQCTQLAEISKVIKEAVNDMPPQRKLIYQLSRDAGLKPAAVAEQLSLSVGTVKNVLSHSLKEIRERLVKYGLFPILFYCLLHGF
jgi:RNA polymerase sigma-70 factor (family 1)